MTPASVGFQCPECIREGRASVRAPRGGGVRAAGRRWGPVTLGLITINVAMFVVTAVAAGLAGFNPVNNSHSAIFVELEQLPVWVQLGDWWRIFTAAFLHIGPIHLALNMLGLLIFGTELENALGRWRFLALYLLSLLGGSTAIQLFGDPKAPVAGASTAIYGLLGALAVLMLVRRMDVRGIVTLLLLNIALSFLPGISLLGHLGGLVVGALITGLFVLFRRSNALQITAAVALGVALIAVALTVPTLAVLGI
jgi:membrane associated rhomboid family serine protease